MKRYYSRLSTPLAFHNFLRYFWIPLAALSMFGMLASAINTGMEDGFDVFLGLTAAYYAFSFASLLAAFIGFFKWRLYAWYSYLVSLAMTPLYLLAIMMVASALAPGKAADSLLLLVGLIPIALYAVPISIYYIKRKPLFTQNEGEASGGPPSEEEA